MYLKIYINQLINGYIPPVSVLVFQEMPYCCVSCRIVSRVVPMSMLHREKQAKISLSDKIIKMIKI